jgi:Protein of unknown function (DUF2637)
LGGEQLMGGRWTYRISAAGVLVLAAAAFTLSYDALHQLALDSRVRPGLAWMWPVVIDGTIVVALLTVLAAKRANAHTGYPWTLAGLFSAASVAFNIAHAPDRPVAQLVFAMAPVALVLTTHLLMQQASWRPQRPTMAGQAPIPTASDGQPPAAPDTGAAKAGHQPDMGRPQPELGAAMAGHEPARLIPTIEAAGQEPDQEAKARRIYEQHQAAGTRLSGAALARHAGISERHGRRLLAEFRAQEADRRNGDGPPSASHARDPHTRP